MTFSFTVSMWVRLVSLGGVEAAAKLLSDIPKEERLPFAPLEDALLAAQNEAHLLLLAPERAELVADLLKVIHPRKRAGLGTQK
jgi:hypothetical protein